MAAGGKPVTLELPDKEAATGPSSGAETTTRRQAIDRQHVFPEEELMTVWSARLRG